MEFRSNGMRVQAFVRARRHAADRREVFQEVIEVMIAWRLVRVARTA